MEIEEQIEHIHQTLVQRKNTGKVIGWGILLFGILISSWLIYFIPICNNPLLLQLKSRTIEIDRTVFLFYQTMVTISFIFYQFVLHFLAGYFKEGNDREQEGFSLNLRKILFPFMFGLWLILNQITANLPNPVIGFPLKLLLLIIGIMYCLFIFVIYVYSENIFFRYFYIFIGIGLYLIIISDTWILVEFALFMGIGNIIAGWIYLKSDTENWTNFRIAFPIKITHSNWKQRLKNHD